MARHPERIIQFGTGRLIRAFADVFIHEANRNGLFDGSIVCIQSTGVERAKALNDAGGRFNLWIRGIEDGETVDQIETIESISRVLPAETSWTAALECARNPEIRFVISNASEIAVVFDADDRIDADPPQSFPGKLTAILYERARHFDFSEDAGLVILPCELLEDNGSVLKDIVIRLADHWQLGSRFSDWVDSANVFCNTLVDRIVTGRPTDSDMEAATERLGYRDEMITVAEPYRLWAIKGDDALRRRVGFAGADAGVIIARDITPFRERKLRLLNGGHTLSVPLGILHGNETVLDNMDHPETGPFIDRLLREEIGPTVPVDPASIAPYIHEVTDRWRNPYLHHRLTDIAWQSTSKMRHRVIATIERYFRKFGRVPEMAARGFAAYLIIMQEDYGIVDDNAGPVREAWAASGGTDETAVEQLVSRVCSNTELWGADLTALPGFADEIVRQIRVLKT